MGCKINAGWVLGALLLSPLATASVTYNPVLYNLAQMYNFNPVKGPVKELKNVMHDSDGNLLYQSVLTMTPDGCIDQFSAEYGPDKANGAPARVLSLTGKDNRLTGKDNSGPVDIITEDCLIVSRTDVNGRLHYENSDNGLLTRITHDGKTISKYDYNPDGRINRVQNFINGTAVADVRITYGDDKDKLLDYRAGVYRDNKLLMNLVSVCHYDVRGVAETCDMAMTDMNKHKITVKMQTTVSYYQ